MENIVFRRCNVSDAPAVKAVYECENAYAGTLQLPYPSDELWAQRLANASDNKHSFVSELNGEVIGHIVLYTEINSRRRHVGGFGMAVKDSYQSKGVGHLLLSSVLDFADNWLNLLRIEMTVFTDNHSAIALYEKNGFVIEGESPFFAYRNGEYVSVYHMGRVRNT